MTEREGVVVVAVEDSEHGAGDDDRLRERRDLTINGQVHFMPLFGYIGSLFKLFLVIASYFHWLLVLGLSFDTK